MAQQEIHCPHCNQALTIEADWIGMELECPVCKNSFTIPAPVPTQPVLTPVNATISTEKSFHFVCPSCNGEAELPESLRGTEYECQFCFDKHIADTAVFSQPSIQQEVEEQKFIFICPECETIAELPESMAGKEYECLSCCETVVATPAEERKCPNCQQKIKIKATICKHCKQSIPPIIPAQTGNMTSWLKTFPKKLSNTVNQPNIALQPGSGQNNNVQYSQASMITPDLARDKTWTGLVLWQLLWPGAGQMYLGQKNKGILCAGLSVVAIIISGCLAFIPGIGFLLSKVVFLCSCAIIIGESFATLVTLQMGISVDRDKWMPRKQQQNITASMPPEMKQKWIKALSAVIVALLLGLTGPGILAWIVILCSL